MWVVCLTKAKLENSIMGFADSDYLGDLYKQRSLTDYLFSMSGSVISWKATLQPTFSFSTIVVEYMALIEVAKEAIWLQGLVRELDLMQERIVFCDSQSAINLTKNQMYH